MEEHLVKNHLGDYYIISGDPKKIKQRDERDEILVSWQYGNAEAQYEALSHYLCARPLLSKDRLEEALAEYGIDEFLDRTIYKIEESIVDDSDAKRSLVIGLEERQELEQELARELKLDISNSEKKQILFVRNFDYSQLDFKNQQNDSVQKKLTYK